ncbi:hemerythrin domain-containing protein [Sphingosinicella sp. LHD-64]|uniref:hemerythrin domain-containing protein n=1 Tax=Sphingosinicella sp. LHD-64 TaxID=3072139 RepID=UPI00280FDC3B|nr:hemerythrin domain-containing protein [Sphingosinicella sp. LHD-64]MDQ8756119.1 hemerythrin domain-containing protein [Sphingosinicella sp. LHD-64]
MNVEDLRAQHEGIMRIAAELRTAVERGDKLQPVAALRWRLARELITHLAIEDRLFYPALMRSADAEAVRVAARLRDETGSFAADFTAYMARWNDLRVAREWEAFRTETKTILDALADRITREDQALYPLAEARGRAA